MNRGLMVMIGAFALGGIYGGWSTMTDTGLGGWVSHAQALIFGGRYSPKLSFFVSMSIITLGVVLVASIVARMMGTTVDGQPPTTKTTSSR